MPSNNVGIKTGIFSHPDFATSRRIDSVKFPEQPARIAAINAHLSKFKIYDGTQQVLCTPCPVDIVKLYHPETYLNLLKESCFSGKSHFIAGSVRHNTFDFKRVVNHWYDLDLNKQVESSWEEFAKWNSADLPLTYDTYDIAMLAAGGVVQAAASVWKGELTRAMCLSRPPGHHAEAEVPMGYCFLNNFAIAIKYLQNQLGLKKALYIDLDVHHGQGGQAAFYSDPQVLVANIHQDPKTLYPFFTGYEDEKGEGKGIGFNCNYPLNPGEGTDTYLKALDDILDKARIMQPQMVFVSFGFDSHKADQASGRKMNLTSSSFVALTAKIVEFANNFCNGKVVIALEGGYHLEACAHGVGAVVRVLKGEDPVLVSDWYDTTGY